MWLIQLVQNEIIKSFLKIKTIVFIIFLLVAIIGAGIFFKMFSSQPTDWKADLQTQITSDETNIEYAKSDASGMADTTYGDAAIEAYNEQIALNQYAIDHNIPINVTTSWNFVENIEFLVNLVFIFMIIAAAESVASEYSTGNIRYLAIKPRSRWKILTGKFVSLAAFSAFFLLVTFLLTVIMGFLFYGGTGSAGISLSMQNGQVIEVSIVKTVLLEYLCQFIKLIVIISMAMMISVLLKSSALSIILSCVLIFGGYIVTTILSTIAQLTDAAKFNWLKYTIFPNLNLAQYLPNGTPAIDGMTLGFSVIMLVLYFTVFTGVSYTVFSKRDIY